MEEKKAGGLGEQQARRKRINRMKMSMVVGMAVWITAVTAVLAVLLVKVNFLEQRLDRQIISKEEVIQEHDAKSAESPKENFSDTVLEDNGPAENEPGGAPDDDISAESAEAAEERRAAIGQDSEGHASETSEEGQALAGEMPEGGMQDGGNSLEEGEHPKVYLTFDDGPSENTAKILDILKERNIKATFFVIGQEDEESRALYRRIVAEGHTLGMHSFSHKYDVIYKSLDAFKEDLGHLQSYLAEVTGVTPTIMRFPGGSSNKVSNVDIRELIRYVKEQGITYYDWNVVSGDATSPVYTPDELVENVMNDVVKYDTSVVLMHDTSAKGSTVEALAPMIDRLQALGADLLPIDENTKPIQHIKAEDVE